MAAVTRESAIRNMVDAAKSLAATSGVCMVMVVVDPGTGRVSLSAENFAQNELIDEIYDKISDHVDSFAPYDMDSGETVFEMIARRAREAKQPSPAQTKPEPGTLDDVPTSEELGDVDTVNHVSDGATGS